MSTTVTVERYQPGWPNRCLHCKKTWRQRSVGRARQCPYCNKRRWDEKPKVKRAA